MHRWQQRRRAEVIRGESPETIALVEHPEVVTIGRRDAQGLEAIAARKIPIIKTERGGLATWHGPGQLVGYPIIHLERRKLGVKVFMELLQQGVIDWLTTQGVPAHRDPRGVGVWDDRGKIASLGIHVHRGVSMHGFAINLNNSMDGFQLFNPCGLSNVRMTAATEHGWSGTMPDSASDLGSSIARLIDTARTRD